MKKTEAAYGLTWLLHDTFHLSRVSRMQARRRMKTSQASQIARPKSSAPLVSASPNPTRIISGDLYIFLPSSRPPVSDDDIRS